MTSAAVIVAEPETVTVESPTLAADGQLTVQSVPVTIAEQPPLIASSTRIPALDGLRGIAILLVLICHLLAQLKSNSGIFRYAVVAGRLTWSGVDLFFVLSGFLIGGILLDARSSPRYYTTFYARRAFRILPIYAVLLALCSLRYLPFHWLPASLGTFSPVEIPWIAYLTFTQNLWMARLADLGLGTLSPTWSLTVEEQFYLTMPVIVRKIPRAKLATVLLSVILGVPVLRVFIHHFFVPSALACHVLMPCPMH